MVLGRARESFYKAVIFFDINKAAFWWGD